MGRLIPVARCGQPLRVRKVCPRIEPCTRTFHRRDRGVARRLADHSTFGRVGTRGSLVPWQRRLGVGRQVGDCAPIPSVDCHRNSRLRCMSALQERHHRLCTAGRAGPCSTNRSLPSQLAPAHPRAVHPVSVSPILDPRLAPAARPAEPSVADQLHSGLSREYASGRPYAKGLR